MLTLIVAAAMLAGSPGGQVAHSWILTKQIDGSVSYVWGYKDSKGFVHSAHKAPGEVVNYGVDRKKFQEVPEGGEWFGGNVPRPDYRPFMRTGATGRPAPRVHLTVIGPKEDRENALADLARNPEYQALATKLGDSLAVQSYDPADPMIAGLKLADGGKPDLIIQNETGKVRFRAHDYPGAERTVAEIRRADPNYDPAKDPTGPKIVLPLEDFLKDMPVINTDVSLMICAVIILAAFAAKKR